MSHEYSELFLSVLPPCVL